MTRAHLPYRPGVGIVVVDARGLVLVGRRIRRVGHEVWQFPQGGVDDGESWLDAAYRELEEETGIARPATTFLRALEHPVRYDLPDDLPDPPRWASRFRGQEQRWVALRFVGTDADVHLDRRHAEFDAIRWIELREAPSLAVPFKRAVYETVATAFRDLVEPRDR